MSSTATPSSPTKLVAIGAMAIGLGAGSYGIASAAGGNGSSSGSTAAATTTNPTAPPGHGPGGWGAQRSDETPLTGDTAAKVQAAATAKLAGATVVRVETDADGHAAYEVHMTKSDGTLATVYVDRDFNVVGVETR